MANLDELYTLRKKVEKAQAESQQAAGALSQAMKTLFKKFGCETKEEAEELLKKWESRKKLCEKKFETEMEKFRKKYPDLFENNEE